MLSEQTSKVEPNELTTILISDILYSKIWGMQI